MLPPCLCWHIQEASLVMGPEETRELLQPIAEQLGVPFLVYPAVPEGPPSTDSAEGVSERLQKRKLEGSDQGRPSQHMA